MESPSTDHCFNNCDAQSNGESAFLRSIAANIKVAFDVGCRHDSEFVGLLGATVHYFDPVESFLKELQRAPHRNATQHFNEFGLSDEDKVITYHPEFQSFLNRGKSCPSVLCGQGIQLTVCRADAYIASNMTATEKIDFLKIDTEGFELNVLRGFGSELKRVQWLQFEYGGTYIDSGVTLTEIITFLVAEGFSNFAYLCSGGRPSVPLGPLPITDHYQYCNIVCERKQ